MVGEEDCRLYEHAGGLCPSQMMVTTKTDLFLYLFFIGLGFLFFFVRIAAKDDENCHVITRAYESIDAADDGGPHTHTHVVCYTSSEI